MLAHAGGHDRNVATISAGVGYPKRRVDVLGRSMTYVESGRGDPVIFLHGNPTSSYLWRNVMPYLDGVARCIAPDLIGMGDSEKLPVSLGPDRYRFFAHRRFLDAFLDSVGVREGVTFVGHDWGGALAFDWAQRHPDAVRGLAYMETIVAPRSWDEWSPEKRAIFQALRSPDGERLVLEENVFVERVLPLSVLRPLSDAEMDVYRAPYRQPGESRRPTLAWPRELPVEGEPEDIVGVVERYAVWLADSDVPKLFVNATPGSALVGRPRERCRSWPRQTEVTVRGNHFLQEDSPHEIGTALEHWFRNV